MWELVLWCHWMHQKDGGRSKVKPRRRVDNEGAGSENEEPDSNVAPIR